MTKDEALKLALNWLVSGNFVYPTALRTAIKAALAKPEQEPFNPDWVSYRQGKLDGAAESLEETKREWVGLNGDHMDDITSTAMDKVDSMLLTEAKLKELNHGI
jgi:hypothetical protein